MFKVNNKDTRTMSSYTPWKHQKSSGFLFSGGIEWRRSGVFIVNFKL